MGKRGQTLPSLSCMLIKRCPSGVQCVLQGMQASFQSRPQWVHSTMAFDDDATTCTLHACGGGGGGGRLAWRRVGKGGRRELGSKDEPALPMGGLRPDAAGDEARQLVGHEDMQGSGAFLHDADQEAHEHHRQGIPAMQNPVSTNAGSPAHAQLEHAFQP